MSQINKYYPSINDLVNLDQLPSSILTVDDIPDVLGFIKDGIGDGTEVDIIFHSRMKDSVDGVFIDDHLAIFQIRKLD